MGRHDYRKCEDEDDAARMAETILRSLGYSNVQRGPNGDDVNEPLSPTALQRIAVNAERIARWARSKR